MSRTEKLHTHTHAYMHDSTVSVDFFGA